MIEPISDKALDLVLGKLRRPNTTEDRLAVLRTLVEYWHGPIHEEDGIPDDDLCGLALPGALFWWYRWAGRRPKIMSGQNHLCMPPHGPRGDWPIKIIDGKLQFYIENQSCYFWSTIASGDDPAVFGRGSMNEPWQPEALCLSEHLIMACILEATFGAPYGACSCDLDEDKFAIITARVPELPIGPWRWCGMRVYAGSGCLMISNLIGRSHGRDFHGPFIGAKTSEALQFLAPLRSAEWGRFDIT